MNAVNARGLRLSFTNKKRTTSKLKQYRKKGPPKTTRMLIDALMAEDVEGLTLMDIGGGVGAIQHALLTAGVTHATYGEASMAYIEAAKEEPESFSRRIIMWDWVR